MATKESTGLRYAFSGGVSVAAYCSASQGLRLVPELDASAVTAAKLEASAGDVVAWPCPNVIALEVDSDDQALLLLEQDGLLYSPRARVK